MDPAQADAAVAHARYKAEFCSDVRPFNATAFNFTRDYLLYVEAMLGRATAQAERYRIGVIALGAFLALAVLAFLALYVNLKRARSRRVSLNPGLGGSSCGYETLGHTPRVCSADPLLWPSPCEPPWPPT
jgi:hypothetical protein